MGGKAAPDVPGQCLTVDFGKLMIFTKVDIKQVIIISLFFAETKSNEKIIEKAENVFYIEFSGGINRVLENQRGRRYIRKDLAMWAVEDLNL